MHGDIESLINTALGEDIQSGDITTRNIISEGQLCEAELIAKDPLILSGLEIFKALFKKLDSGTVFLYEPFNDGEFVPKGSTIIKFRCDCTKLLEGERSGLNILQWLSGVATFTRKFVDKASPVTVLDTRKTTPGLRVSKPTLLLKPMPLKNALESGVIENHASAICCGLGKRGKQFIPPKIRILWQKSKMRKLLICQNTMDALCEFRAKLKKFSSCEKVLSLFI